MKKDDRRDQKQPRGTDEDEWERPVARKTSPRGGQSMDLEVEDVIQPNKPQRPMTKDDDDRKPQASTEKLPPNDQQQAVYTEDKITTEEDIIQLTEEDAMKRRISESMNVASLPNQSAPSLNNKEQMEEHRDSFKQSADSLDLGVMRDTAGINSNQMGDAELTMAAAMPVLRRQRPTSLNDNSERLHPSSRLVKVQPETGQRQPGAYAARSSTRQSGTSPGNLSTLIATQSAQGRNASSEDPIDREVSELTMQSTMQSTMPARTTLPTHTTTEDGVAGDSVVDEDQTIMSAPVRISSEGDIAEQASSTTAKQDAKKRRCRLFYGLGILVLVIAVAAGVGIAVAVSGGNGSDESSSIPTQPPVCTMDPVFEQCADGQELLVPDCLMDRYQDLTETFVPTLSVTIPEGTCDPHSLALVYLAWTSNEDETAMQNLFGLAVLYFSLGVQGLDSWLTSESYCTWQGIACDEANHTFAINLESTYVSASTMLDGTLPESLVQLLPQLSQLFLSGHTIHGTIPQSYANLAALIIGNNDLSGTLPQTLLQSTSLATLIVSNNPFDESSVIPASIPGRQWENLGLGNIPFQKGPFPLDLLFSTLLTRLDLENTNLTGSIPSEIGRLTRIESLKLDMNKLNGTLPTELGNLVNMDLSLALQSNEFVGTIPSELGRLTRVDELALHQNSLTGPLPFELGRLLDAQVISFMLNGGLEGEIPLEVCSLRRTGRLTSLGNPNEHSCRTAGGNYGGLTCPAEDGECCKCLA
jgi:hypothetical protein